MSPPESRSSRHTIEQDARFAVGSPFSDGGELHPSGRKQSGPWAWLESLERRSPDFLATMAGIAVLVLAVLNVMVDAEVTFSVLYLIPIGVVSWYISRTAGI